MFFFQVYPLQLASDGTSYITPEGESVVIISLDSLKQNIPENDIRYNNITIQYIDRQNNKHYLDLANGNKLEDVNKPHGVTEGRKGIVDNQHTKKPARPCLFCPNYQCYSNLRRHQVRKHYNKIEHILKLTDEK